jgi:hypothetical protein
MVNREGIIASMAIHRSDKCAKALLIVLLVVILVSGAFIVTHAQHDCIGHGCHTCAEISICRLVIEGIGFAAFLIFALARARRGEFVRRADGLIVKPGPISKARLFSGHIRLNC